MIGLSDKAAKANPTLAAWLDGAGLRVRRFAAGSGWATGPAIVARDEVKTARPCDLVIDQGGPPSLIRATATAPSFLRYGTDDLGFGKTLIVQGAIEIVLAGFRPARLGVTQEIDAGRRGSDRCHARRRN